MWEDSATTQLTVRTSEVAVKWSEANYVLLVVEQEKALETISHSEREREMV